MVRLLGAHGFMPASEMEGRLESPSYTPRLSECGSEINQVRRQVVASESDAGSSHSIQAPSRISDQTIAPEFLQHCVELVAKPLETIVLQDRLPGLLAHALAE